MLKILALDLGTKTGVARNYGPPPFEETWELSTATEVTRWGKQRLTRRCDPRIGRLYQRLIDRHQEEPDLIVFEDVEFSTYTKQTQLWASFRTAVWLAFDGRAVIECVSVTTLKKFATGSGAADKAAMRRAMFKQFPDTSRDLDDNAIDALWVLKWAEKNLSRTILP
jgi:Holliday junction resolvasome RuvABC endonuclease subunit